MNQTSEKDTVQSQRVLSYGTSPVLISGNHTDRTEMTQSLGGIRIKLDKFREGGIYLGGIIF